MDSTKESSSSFDSNVFNSQPLSSYSEISESSQNKLRNNSILSLVSVNDNFPVNKVMVLSPYIEKVPELIGSYNKVVLEKDKGEKQKHIAERDFHTIFPSNSSSLNTMRAYDVNHNHNKNEGKAKGKEHEHVTERDFHSIIPFTSLNNMQIDGEYGILEPKFTKQQLCEHSYVGCIKKVINFFNSYNYTLNIFDIVIDFSDKYQEIFPEDNFYLRPFHNIPCILFKLLNNLLLYRLNLGDDDVRNIAKLEMLTEKYYEKLTNAEIIQQELYNTSFINRKPCSKSLNKESEFIRNSINNNLPISSESSGIDQKLDLTAQSHNSSKSFRSTLGSDRKLKFKTKISSESSRIDQNLNLTAQSHNSSKSFRSTLRSYRRLNFKKKATLANLPKSYIRTIARTYTEDKRSQILKSKRFRKHHNLSSTAQSHISPNLNSCVKTDNNTHKPYPYFNKKTANTIQELAIADLTFRYIVLKRILVKCKKYE
ncbi:hypothetical protein C1645_740242 [Glomus cerebriforme]|uniref:Uncharacterized protein n=1 Tax=Glomus cerebriforme TaxID=658196 RepID=A0A397STD6_9GLOM|nr:hypothetical protein C1645_740242 [Glomus cerebriforme]